MIRPSLRLSITWAGIALLCLGSACDRSPTIVPVSGKISIDGKPVTAGSIQVYPKNYRAASAKIEQDGSFKLQTFKDFDGCVLGEHGVTVFSNETINDKSSRYYVPERYSQIETSDVKIAINGPQSDLQIHLTWQGSGFTKPYEKRE
jgi:hypothetical protein